MENKIYGTIVLVIVALIAIFIGPDIYSGSKDPNAAFYIFFFLLLLLGLKLRGVFPFRQTDIEKNTRSIKVGDTVKLKSGSNLMTVLNIEDGMVSCVWHDRNNQPQQETYAIRMLQVSK